MFPAVEEESGVGEVGKRVWLIWCMDGNVAEREWEPLVQLVCLTTNLNWHLFFLLSMYVWPVYVWPVCVAPVCVAPVCVWRLCVWPVYVARTCVCVCSFIRIECTKYYSMHLTVASLGNICISSPQKDDAKKILLRLSISFGGSQQKGFNKNLATIQWKTKKKKETYCCCVIS